MNRLRLYYVILAIAIALYLVLELNKPQPINWSKTFASTDKIPYGTYVLRQLITEVFTDKIIKPVRKPVYNVINHKEAAVGSDTALHNYLIIADKVEFDSLEIDKMFDFVLRGNNFFISVNSYLPEQLTKPLGFKTDEVTSFEKVNDTISFSDVTINNGADYIFNADYIKYFFVCDELDPVEVLGYNKQKMPDFIRVKYGNGYFYFNSNPVAFTNYYLLNDSTMDYAYYCLSYLPVNDVLWDDYYTLGPEGEKTLFGIITRFPSLKNAFYIALFVLILFVIFEGRRRQRIIPVIKPNGNTTMEFLETLSDLYHTKGSHREIALKRINYFYEILRERFLITPVSVTGSMVDAVAAKTAVDRQQLIILFNLIEEVKDKPVVSGKLFLRLNRNLEWFYTMVNK